MSACRYRNQHTSTHSYSLSPGFQKICFENRLQYLLLNKLSLTERFVLLQMKTLLHALILLGSISFILCSCLENDDKQQCNELDYMKYVQCVRRKLRLKRSDDCEDNCADTENCPSSCDECNCNYCTARTCENFCSQCCQSTTCTTASCCHRTCHAQCRTSRCRNECKKDCNKNIEQQDQRVDIETGNITTIITLHTAINNTNIIDVPISINNTNVNNFTLDSSLVYPDSHPLLEKVILVNSTMSSSQNCCNVVGQGNCTQTPTWPFFNCSHPITQQCGPFCRSSIVHKQPIRNCVLGQCMDQIAYIPQPRPRCVYHPAWPYISCGVPQQPFCGGCYQHYSFPFQPPSIHCSPGCYDEGYGTGPYYRQGPFYRRFFSHVPSCYQIMGNCYGAYEMIYSFQGSSEFWNTEYPQFYPPSMNYPYNFNGNVNLLTPDITEEVNFENTGKLPTEPASTKTIKLQPPVTVEAQVNYTNSLINGKKSSKATLAIETNKGQ